MLNRIRTYFEERKKRKQLTTVLKLLYSDTIYSIDELINDLKLSNEVEILEHYILISVATQLKVPFTENDITEIYSKQIGALEMYVASKELRKKILDLEKGLAKAFLNKFNAEMNFLRHLYSDNKYSHQGMLLSMMKAKGRPLTLEEGDEINLHYEKIKKAEEKKSTLLEQAEHLFKEESPSE